MHSCVVVSWNNIPNAYFCPMPTFSTIINEKIMWSAHLACLLLCRHKATIITTSTTTTTNTTPNAIPTCCPSDLVVLLPLALMWDPAYATCRTKLWTGRVVLHFNWNSSHCWTTAAQFWLHNYISGLEGKWCVLGILLFYTCSLCVKHLQVRSVECMY